MNALVIGGTGPTGPFLVKGLLERGYAVKILHRGTHEIPEIPAAVPHVHADPHFRETLDEALKGQFFDLVIATYGRLRLVAEAVVGKTGRFIGIGGVSAYRGYLKAGSNFPLGLTVPLPEEAPVVVSQEEQRFAYLIAETEKSVLKSHPTATILRYPYVYGPRQLVPREWCIIRRILDKRPFIVVPYGGLTMMMHGYAENLAHSVMLAVDNPDIAAGRTYNCGDTKQFSLGQLVELVSNIMGHRLEVISVPAAAASVARGLVLGTGHWHHRVMDLHRIRSELAYADLVPPEEGLVRTVRWYVDHPLERGGATEKMLIDNFDYASEDKLAIVARDTLQSLMAVDFGKAQRKPHAYAHPKTPGEQDHRNR